MKHNGSLESLRDTILACGCNISEENELDNFYQIKTKEGAIINWYQSTGTLQFQGKKAPKEKLKNDWATYTGDSNQTSVLSQEAPSTPVSPTNVNTASKKVFVVHGHDSIAREQLELVLHKLGLNPFVLANTGGGGLTIIEALEKEIGPKPDQARFGIVLMTPDDMGYSKEDGPEAIEPRARQNVILELGMLISAIGRPNIAILKKGHLEEPSDAKGVLYISFNDHVKETVPKLTNRLNEAGFVLNPDAISNASS